MIYVYISKEKIIIISILKLVLIEIRKTRNFEPLKHQKKTKNVNFETKPGHVKTSLEEIFLMLSLFRGFQRRFL